MRINSLKLISMKLTEQRKYVLWLDTQEKSKGGRGKTRLRSETGLPDRRETIVGVRSYQIRLVSKML